MLYGKINLAKQVCHGFEVQVPYSWVVIALLCCLISYLSIIPDKERKMCDKKMYNKKLKIHKIEHIFLL